MLLRSPKTSDTLRDSGDSAAKRLASPCHPRSPPGHLEVCSGTLDAETPESSPPVGRRFWSFWSSGLHSCTGQLGGNGLNFRWNSNMCNSWFDSWYLLVTIGLNNPQFRILIAIGYRTFVVSCYVLRSRAAFWFSRPRWWWDESVELKPSSCWSSNCLRIFAALVFFGLGRLGGLDLAALCQSHVGSHQLRAMTSALRFWVGIG